MSEYEQHRKLETVLYGHHRALYPYAKYPADPCEAVDMLANEIMTERRIANKRGSLVACSGCMGLFPTGALNTRTVDPDGEPFCRNCLRLVTRDMVIAADMAWTALGHGCDDLDKWDWIAKHINAERSENPCR